LIVNYICSRFFLRPHRLFQLDFLSAFC
jgi:hypothetical protein